MKSILDLQDVVKRPFAYEGYNPAYKGWVCPPFMNAHVHFRDPNNPDEINIFNLVIPETVKIYRHATAMANLAKNRVLTGDQARAYRDRILTHAHRFDTRFDVTVPFCVEVGLDLPGLKVAFQQDHLLAGKLYPENATTHSSSGVDFRRIREIFPLLALMQEYDRILLVHSEMVKYENGRLIPDRLREQEAIAVIDLIRKTFPSLRIVCEHISSAAMVKAVMRWQAEGSPLEATIAPQYLLWDSTVLFEGGMNPAYFSIPILKDHEDRMAIIEFMVNGGGMLGTDSAPHNVWKKSQAVGCAGGVFNEPVSIHVYFHIFRQYGGKDWFERFVDFACRKGPRFYGLQEPAGRILIKEKSWLVPKVYQKKPATVYTSVMPLLGGQRVPTSAMPT